ncbi:hypothetical protein JMJ56_32805 [Belnapia sp. T18]|uniref:Uncharacterized protein n=1 Tax=Belnapia arida TaxID=2804533 RepID=A0ABS1UDY3_9PROT|nr:hypothetical protein [Belnapia arida]MBL6082740.1 hypothetical protein [Belnapia arida]
MRRSAFRIGGRIFYLDAATAAQVNELRLTDLNAALALADRSSRAVAPPGGSVSTSLLFLDGANKMTQKIVDVNGQQLIVDANVGTAIESLQGQNTMLQAIIQGRTGGGQVQDAASAAMVAVRQDFASRRDPKTPYGAHVKALSDVWKNSGV